MAEQEQRALVPVVTGTAARAAERLPARGVWDRALALLSDAPAVRRAAVVGVAFGAGFQLSRMWRAGRLRGVPSTARDVYRGFKHSDPEAEGRLAGNWVRYSFSVVSTLYGIVDRDERD